MEGLLPFASALGLILVLELGDKTQLATISLATRHPWAPVLAGAATGLVLVTAIGAAIGGVLAAYLDAWLAPVKIAGGVLFILFGIWSYLRKEDDNTARGEPRGPYVTAFLVNFVAELGDKTQLAVIVLAASTAAPVSVFAGASLGLATIAALSVGIGAGLARVIEARWLRIASTVLFLAAGVLLIVEAILGG
ncbi:MAG: hypothetical protein A3K66_04520 [Euryarchaeota archaeon RBG_16_67_27]|nr:MAG: hypothetical protein A3K66_04520 [Euryarchaeota archaeon RBG_16_67_27]